MQHARFTKLESELRIVVQRAFAAAHLALIVLVWLFVLAPCISAGILAFLLGTHTRSRLGTLLRRDDIFHAR